MTASCVAVLQNMGLKDSSQQSNNTVRVFKTASCVAVLQNEGLKDSSQQSNNTDRGCSRQMSCVVVSLALPFCRTRGLNTVHLPHNKGFKDSPKQNSNTVRGC